jgi:acyl-CoA reductase-like NAD-dependent aldehyde dehydrogenase
MSIDWFEQSRQISPRVCNFIDGGWRSEGGGGQLEKYGPRDGRLLYRFGESAAQDVEAAVLSARGAYEDGRWSRLPLQQRKDALFNLAALIEEHARELALLECLDVGKPISDALSFDVPTAAAAIRFFAEAADKCYGKVYAADSSSLSYQLRRPIGVVAGVVGWNFPLVLAAGKIGPVLAVGNCLILKPSELTPSSAARLAELALAAGIPPGVFNVIHGGPETGAALAQHGRINLITFTGSTHTGKRLLKAAGESNMKRLVLECGGKAPNIVFDDSPDLDAVAESIVARAFWNQGQVCTASSRLLVQRSIKSELLPLVIAKAAALIPGDPLAANSKLGAVVSLAHQQKILSYMECGLREGARIAFRGDSSSPPCEGGFYVSPVIFDDVSPKLKIAQEEIFGPVLSVMYFDDEAEAIRLANDTIYGLSAILWTKDLGRAHRVTQEVEAGWIVVNATSRPTGGPGEGVMALGGHKESGLGIEGGIEGLEAYTSNTAVQIFV